MPRVQRGADPRVIRERQHALRGDHLAPSDDHGAVVQRRAGIENRLQQPRRHRGPKGRPGRRDIIQAIISLDHHQRPEPALREPLRGLDQLVDYDAHILAAQHQPAHCPEPTPPHLFERVSKLGVKQDHDGDRRPRGGDGAEEKD